MPYFKVQRLFERTHRWVRAGYVGPIDLVFNPGNRDIDTLEVTLPNTYAIPQGARQVLECSLEELRPGSVRERHYCVVDADVVNKLRITVTLRHAARPAGQTCSSILTPVTGCTSCERTVSVLSCAPQTGYYVWTTNNNLQSVACPSMCTSCAGTAAVATEPTACDYDFRLTLDTIYASSENGIIHPSVPGLYAFHLIGKKSGTIKFMKRDYMSIEENKGVPDLAVYTETQTRAGPNIFTFKFTLPEIVSAYAPDTTPEQKAGRIFFEFPTLDYDGVTPVFQNTGFVYSFTETEDNYESAGQVGCWVSSELRVPGTPVKCRVIESESQSTGAPILVELLNFK
jgi:hypothetical protein